MEIRTDLALELSNRRTDFTEGIRRTECEEYGVKSTKIEIFDERAAEEIGKPMGEYITLEFQNLLYFDGHSTISKKIFENLQTFNFKKNKKFLIVGLGNPEITSDSIGPETAKMVLATRHIMGEFAEKIGLLGLRSVSVIVPDVLGNTGLEVIETVKGVCETVKPDALIVIDALASGSINRLFTTVQICNTGISPGSGVKNARKELSEKTVGVPVIAIGVPTVVDADTLVSELTNKKQNNTADLILTPKDADILTKKISEIIAYALNIFLQPEIDPEIIQSLV